MSVWRRPSFYLASVPIAGMLLADVVHQAMGCGYKCTGPVSGPIDRAALFALYLFGYGISFFMGLAAVVFVGEVLYRRWRRRAA